VATTVAEPIDAYLDQLERGLDLPTAERAAVREEIGSHLIDEQASLIAEGLDPAAAAVEAIHRQGDALVLGQALTRARQSRRALLAAAGAGTVAAAGAGVRALILATATLVAILLAVGLVAAVVTRGGTSASVFVEAGWFTAVGATTLWFAAWAAGRSFVAVAARESHRPAGRLRPWIALLGGLAVAWLILAWLRVPQNLASVLVLAAVPVCFVAAAVTASDRPIARTRLARRAGLALFVTLAFGLPILALVGATPAATTLSAIGSGPYASMADLLKAQNLDLTGRILSDVPDIGGSSWSQANGIVSVAVDNGDVVTSRWHDLRFEAWRATLATNALDRGWTTPFASAPAALTNDQQLDGTLRVDGTRNVSEFIVVLTGVAADGQRDFLTSLGGTNTWFTGSVLGWLTAP
jgi:hypothetical protein